MANIELAEREGFEPPVRLPVRRISSAVRSTTLPPLHTADARRHLARAGASNSPFRRDCHRGSPLWGFEAGFGNLLRGSGRETQSSLPWRRCRDDNCPVRYVV